MKRKQRREIDKQKKKWFDEDVNNLYQEEYQLMIKGKHKTK